MKLNDIVFIKNKGFPIKGIVIDVNGTEFKVLWEKDKSGYSMIGYYHNNSYTIFIKTEVCSVC